MLYDVKYYSYLRNKFLYYLVRMSHIWLGPSNPRSKVPPKTGSYVLYFLTEAIRWTVQYFTAGLRIQDVYPGSDFFHPGSEFFPSRNPDQHQKNLSILTKKLSLSSRKYDPGCSPLIRILLFFLPGYRIQGSKRHRIPDQVPQHSFTKKLGYMLWFTAGLHFENLFYPRENQEDRYRTW